LAQGVPQIRLGPASRAKGSASRVAMSASATPRLAREPLVTAASGGNDFDDRQSGPPIAEVSRSFLKAELSTMWAIGWPMAVSFFCRFAMISMDAGFVGHLSGSGSVGSDVDSLGSVAPERADALSSLALAFSESPAVPFMNRLMGQEYQTKDYLAAASLSDMITQMMTIPLLAMGFGIGPLVGQALGAGNPKKAGTWVQISIFCIFVASLPFQVAFFFVGDVLRALGFHPNLCTLAGKYAKFSVIWVIPNCWYVALRFYFQTQGIARPAMYNGLIFLAVNAGLNWCLVFGGPFKDSLGWQGFGFIGAALAISTSRSLQCFVYWVYMFVYRRAHVPTWPGWNCDFLRWENMRPFLAQTLPQVGTLLLQMAINQSITLLVATLGTLAVAASSAAQAATMPFTMFFMATLSALAGMRVGFHLGSGRADLARLTAWLVLGTGTLFMAAFAAVIIPFRHELMSLVTSDEEVQDLAAQILPAITLNFLAASVVQCVTGGILASQGRTRLSTLLSLGFELPLSLGSIAMLVLVFNADVRLVYWVQAGVSVAEAFVVFIIAKRSDWEKYAAAAQARQRQPAPQANAGAADAVGDRLGPSAAEEGVAPGAPPGDVAASEEKSAGLPEAQQASRRKMAQAGA